MNARYAALLVLALTALVIPFTSVNGAIVGPAVSPVTDAQNGYPTWYQDGHNVRIAACLDGADPNCVLPAAGEEPNFDPGKPTVFASNFPSEFFYWLADSDIVNTPGCNGSAPGRAFIRTAVEGAFGGADPAPGDQITFGRIRIVVTSGLCPNTAYTFTHPYGADTFVTNDLGGLARNVGTEDIGCAPVAPDTCDFAEALGSRVFDGFLRWDPAVAPAAPAGYVGDALTPHRVVGSPTGNNLFRISRGLTVVGETNLFTVAGKLSGPLESAPTSIDYVGQTVNTVSASRSVTFTNTGGSALSINNAAVTGANGNQFRITANGCAGLTLAADSSCVVNVAFGPTTTGTKNAALTVTHSGLNSPLSVPLTGVGTAVGANAAFAASPASLDFGQQKAGTLSAAQTVTVKNDGGTAPMRINGVAVSGAFDITRNGCPAGTVLAAAASCTIDVAFAPLAGGPATGSLTVTDNAPGSPHAVSLAGIGFAGTPAVSADRDSNNGYATWYGDANGLRVEPCVDGSDPLCILPAAGEEPGWDPGRPTNFPDNFPSEFFYWVADSDIVATPGCGASPPGKAFIREGLEGAFSGDGPAPNEQIVFGRIRIVVTSGLCPNTTYRFTHPYGVETVTTNSQGAVPRNAATEDIGCFPVAPAVCDFSLPLASRIFDGYLRWDPSVAPAAPVGYLGDGVTPHKVVGSPNGTNLFRIQTAAGATVGETDLWTIGSGRIAGPLVSKPSPLEFGGQDVGSTSALRAATLTNLGITPLTISTVSVGGADATSYGIATDGCTGLTLARDESCVVNVAFAPTTLGKLSAHLAVAHDGIRSPLLVALTGTGTVAAAAPQVALSRTSVAFGNQRVITRSPAERVTVSNTGNAPLAVSSAVISGTNAGDFSINLDLCTGRFIDAGSSCAIDVVFGPTVAGARTASLDLVSNAPASPHSAALSGTGTGGKAAVSPDLDANNRYPLWYQDEDLNRVQPCLDGADAQCVLPAAGDEPGFDPGLPTSFPGNFPTEFFYWLADSDLLNTPGCPSAGIAPGKVKYRAALEGAFLNGDPAAGEQISFGRIRIVANGLCPNTEYSFTHPYGVETITANDLGAVTAVMGTEDIGCVPTPPATCNFAEALPSRVFGGFLRWNPAVAPAAPAGYLGDVGVPHEVVGSPLGTNEFAVSQAGALVAQTNLFTVSGKLLGAGAPPPPPPPAGAPAVSLAPTTLAYGDQVVNRTSAAQAVTVTNSGNAPLTVSGLTIAGLDFAVASNTCLAAPVAAGASCTVNVTFTPQALGPRSSSLQIASDAAGSPHGVALTGTGIAAPVPAASVAPAALAFADQVVSTTSASQAVTVTNSGNAPLTVSGLSIAGLDFAVASSTCLAAPVAAGASCTVNVTFTPQALGARSSSLSIADNAANSPQVVALSGNGIAAPAPAVSLAPTSLTFADRQVGTGASASQLVTVTNSGTAALVFGGVAVAGTGDFAVATNACIGSLAVGASCTIGVTFAPTATGLRTGSLRITSNAAGSPHGVALSGNGLAPPPAAATFLAGNQTVEAKLDSNAPGLAEAFKTTASASGSVTQLRVFVDTGSTATSVVAGLYANSATNHPGALLTSGTIAAPVAGQFNAVSVPAANITAGQTYWIAILGPSGTLRFRDRAAVGAGSSEVSQQTTLSGLPATWSSGASFSDGALSAWAGGTLSPTPPPPPPPPAPGLSVLVGNAATEAKVDSNVAGLAEAFKTTAATTGSVTRLRVFVDAGSTAGSVVVGLYSNNAGHPGTLLTSGTITAPVAGQNNEVAVTATSVTAGQTYWIAVLGPSGTLRFRDRGAVGAGSSETSAQANLTGLPASWTTGASFADGLLSAVGLG